MAHDVFISALLWTECVSPPQMDVLKLQHLMGWHLEEESLRVIVFGWGYEDKVLSIGSVLWQPEKETRASHPTPPHSVSPPLEDTASWQPFANQEVGSSRHLICDQLALGLLHLQTCAPLLFLTVAQTTPWTFYVHGRVLYRWRDCPPKAELRHTDRSGINICKALQREGMLSRWAVYPGWG